MNKPFVIDNTHKLENLSFVKILQILSLDVVLGSVCGGLMATKVIGINPGIVWWFVLPFAVWLVYTVDHLSDGLKLGKRAQSKRHLFHYKYRKLFIIIIVLIGLSTGVIAFWFLNVRIVLFGLFLGGIVIIYLILNITIQRFKPVLFQKEIIISIIYTFGIWGGPLALKRFNTEPVNWIILILFVIVAITNLIIFSCYEKEKDIADNQSSIVQILGEKTSSLIIYLLGFLVMIVGIISMIYYQPEKIQIASIIILTIMQFILLNVFINKTYFGKNDRFRFYGDIVFVLPVCLLLF